MFVLKDDHTYTWPVTIPVPGEGRHERHRITCKFRALPQDRLDELVGGPLAGTGDRAGSPDAAVLREALIGWDGVQDEDGNPLGFDDESRDRLLGIPFVRTAMVRAYFASVNGIEQDAG